MKSLNESLEKLSMKENGQKDASVHLTSQEARDLHNLAGDGNNQTSAMDRYMEMKNKQDLLSMENSSSAH